MPSLRALAEFKSSFSHIGREPETLAELELQPDELPLPDHEPAAPPKAAPAKAVSAAEAVPADDGAFGEDTSGGDGTEADYIDFGDLGDLLGGMDAQEVSPVPDEEDFPEFADGDTDAPAVSAQDDIDFGNFIDSIPDDFGSSGAAEDVPREAGSPDSGADSAGFNADDLNLDDPGLGEENVSSDGLEPDTGEFPAELLNGFADEIEDGRASGETEDVFNIDALPEFGEAAPETENAGFNADDLNLDDLGLGEENVSSGGLEPDTGEFPAELLNGFADEIEDGRASGETEAVFDIDALPEFDDAAPETEDAPSADNSGMPDLENYPIFDSGEVLELAGEERESGAGSSSSKEPEPPPDRNGEAASSFSLPEEIPDFEDAGSAETGLETAAPDSAANEADSAEDFSGDEDSFDLGGEAPDFDNDAVLEELPGDPFDNFKLDTDVTNDFDLGGEDSGSFRNEFGKLEEFSLPGIDDIAEGESSGGAAPGSARKGTPPEETDEVEEIILTDEELKKFQAALSSYPLNLRIACEELIAEQAVAPDQMSRLVKLLINGAPAGETAALAGKILDRAIPIPRGFEKRTGEALEAEQSSFAYIFVHNFLPVLRLFAMIAAALLSVGYLGWRFIYTPLRAEKIYELGYERIGAGEYPRANERFREAFNIHEKKSWFYEYARAFREARQYILAEEKYQELLYYTASKNKKGIPEKAAVLEFADMETNAIGNYEKADQILRRNILDYSPWDREALLAVGDNSLAWGEYEPSRLEDARESYAKYMERYGRTDPLLERMLKYFIRTDNLEETLSLQSYFMASDKSRISSAALAELGGYLLDKRFEEVQGVPNAYLDNIGGIREILLRAIQQEQMLPEPYYQLARYYNSFENFSDEKITLELAVRVFDAAKEESPRRIRYRIDTLRRYGEALTKGREFFPAEDALFRAKDIYEDAVSRRLLERSPEFGRVYSDLGDLEYFSKDGDMKNALDLYGLAEQSGWAPPEIQYRMGAAHYQLREWGPAQDRFFTAYREIPPGRRILYALGNVSYMRGNYFAAQGYYDRLLDILEDDRDRLPPIEPTEDENQLDLAERLMVVQNNLGVTLETLTKQTGDNSYRSRAHGLLSDSARAWDILTRDPESMLRMRPSPDLNAPTPNAAYLNIRNSLHPVPGYEPLFFLRIDKDVDESSAWEELVDLPPPGYRLSERIYADR